MPFDGNGGISDSLWLQGTVVVLLALEMPLSGSPRVAESREIPRERETILGGWPNVLKVWSTSWGKLSSYKTNKKQLYMVFKEKYK